MVDYTGGETRGSDKPGTRPYPQDKKVKTKAAMLQELESIKGLLVEEDAIPILQEVIEPPATSTPPLQAEQLHQLKDQFQALQRDMDDAPRAQTSASLLDAFTRASQIPAKSPAPAVSPEPAAQPSSPARSQASLFAETDEQGNAFEANHTPERSRPALAKASGENPFLPQHIRARLHGNNPPPVFDLKRPDTSRAPVKEPRSRQELIDSLMESMLPRMEEELRQRLEKLSREALQDMMSKEEV